MSEVAKKLTERRNRLWAEARQYIEIPAEQNRQLTAEENGAWMRAMEELDDLDKKLEGALTEEKRQRATDDAFNSIVSRQPEVRKGAVAGYGQSDGGDLNAELRAVLRGESGSPRSMEIRHHGVFGQAEYRTLQSNTGSPTAIVPTDFYDRLIAHLIEVSGIMQAGPTVLNTAGGESLLIPKTTAHSTAALTGQGAQLPTSDPTFAQVTLQSYKYGVMIQVARELLDDTAVDILGYLAMECGRAVGNAVGTDLVMGNGSSKPTGLINAISGTPGVTGGISTTMSATGGTTGSPSYANLVDMEYSVIAPYRQSRSCYWMAADKTIGAIRKITDNQGRPVWEPSVVLGSPDLLLGKPIVADFNMPAIAANGVSIAFGDFAPFFVRLVGGVRFERSDDYAFNTDLVTFRCLLRADGTLVDTNAIKAFKGGAT
jgi:HK97 family phage major capsid protein